MNQLAKRFVDPHQIRVMFRRGALLLRCKDLLRQNRLNETRLGRERHDDLVDKAKSKLTAGARGGQGHLSDAKADGIPHCRIEERELDVTRYYTCIADKLATAVHQDSNVQSQ